MPTPKFLKIFSWEDSPEGSPDASLGAAPTAPAGFAPPETYLVVDPNTSQRSDHLKKACDAVDMLAIQVEALVDKPQIIKDGIMEGVNTFMEVVPPIMDALDGLAAIHPFVAGTGEPVLNTQILICNLLLSCRCCIQGCLHTRNDASEQRSKGYCHTCRVRRA